MNEESPIRLPGILPLEHECHTDPSPYRLFFQSLLLAQVRNIVIFGQHVIGLYSRISGHMVVATLYRIERL